jgi:hypothetical protein
MRLSRNLLVLSLVAIGAWSVSSGRAAANSPCQQGDNQCHVENCSSGSGNMEYCDVYQCEPVAGNYEWQRVGNCNRERGNGPTNYCTMSSCRF